MKQTTIFQKHNKSKPQKKINTDELRVLSLFSGGGGLDLGFKGGFKFRNMYFDKNLYVTHYANDFDPAAKLVFKANKKYFASVNFVKKDIKEIKLDEIPDFDIMLAGFPCQPFSNAGHRKGIQDKQGTLFEEGQRILLSKQNAPRPPKGFIFENVRGILSIKMQDGTSVPDEIVKRTKKMGYNTVYKLIKASDYGVPSSRYRVIMIGLKEEYGSFDFELLEKVVREHNIPTEKTNKYELLLGRILSDITPDLPQAEEFWKFSPSAQYMVDKIGKCNGDEATLNMFRKSVSLNKMDPKVIKGRSWKDMPKEAMPQRFRKIYDNPSKYRAPNFYRRFSLAEINGTITASAQPENCGITHPLVNRRFTIREIARIQSFPDDFIFPYTTIANAYKIIGNAVPPILGWVIARAVMKHFNLD